MGMNLHGWTGMSPGLHALDPRAQTTSGNLLYTYGSHHAVLPNFAPVSLSGRYDSGPPGKPVGVRFVPLVSPYAVARKANFQPSSILYDQLRRKNYKQKFKLSVQ